jgi:hypothetical protein
MDGCAPSSIVEIVFDGMCRYPEFINIINTNIKSKIDFSNFISFFDKYFNQSSLCQFLTDISINWSNCSG